MKRTLKLPLKVPFEGDGHRSPKAKGRRKAVLPNGITWKFIGGRRSVFSHLLRNLSGKDRGRLRDTWLSISGFLEIISPGLVKGLSLTPRLYQETRSGILKLYRWLLRSWCFQGGDWTLSRVASLCDWALYYSIESDYSRPEVESGTIGATRDGWVLFPWAKGVLRGLLLPTKGPYSPEGASSERNSFHLYTLYSVKGGLPVPSQEKCKKSLELHQETTTSGGVTSEGLLNLAEDFAELYRSEFPPSSRAITLTNTSSSTYDFSRREGGRAAFVRGVLSETLEGLKCRTHYIGSHTAIGGYWDFLPAFLEGPESNMILRDYSVLFLLERARGMGFVPEPVGDLIEGEPYTGRYRSPPTISLDGFEPKPYPTRAVAVEEQGNKARVVTPADSVVATLLHLVRTYCYSSLKKDPEVGTISGEGTLVSFMKRANKALEKADDEFLEKRVVMSLDLSRATDTFHQDLITRLCRGYLKDPTTPSVVRILSPLATSPMEVEYEDLDTSVTNRGIAMANPSSWFFLNLFNRFFWELSGALLRAFPRLSVKGILKEVEGGRLKDVTFRGTPGDPLTSRCGDDQISFTTAKRALLFEGLLPMGGAIISPGVHAKSRNLGTYTKQVCILDRVQKRFRFLDILRVRSLSTPDSRLPGKKEVPPSWSRGIAASKELAWWKDPVYAGACTYLHWRYAEFLRLVISLKIEPWVPRKFGGLEYPHYKRELKFLSPKTPRMISILLRADYNVSNLLSMERLGGLWDPQYSGDLGRKSDEVVSAVLAQCDFTHIERARADGLLDGVPVEVYPQWWTLTPIEEKLKESSWFPLKDFLQDLRGLVQGQLSWNSELPAIQKVPSLRAVARKFHKLRQEILSRDTYQYQDLQSSTFDELCKRLDWKTKVVFVRDTASRNLERLRNESYSDDQIDQFMGLYARSPEPSGPHEVPWLSN